MKGASPLIRKQLIAFAIVSVVGAVVLAVTFLRVPEQLGIGRHTVTADFRQGAGIYQGAEVVYLGHPVGKVHSLELTEDGLRAELRLVDDVDVPATVTAEIHSRSAVGEQYVSLVPDGVGDAALADGDHIPVERTSYPVEIGPVLDNVQALVTSIDRRALNTFVREAGDAFAGGAGDLQAILDGSSSFLALAEDNLDPTRDLIDRAAPVLTTVNDRSTAIEDLLANLDQFTAELRASDGNLRSLLDRGPAATNQVIALMRDLGVSLPSFLGQTNPVLGLLRTYNPHLEQLLSDYPVALSLAQSVTLANQDTDEARLTLGNVLKPPQCIDGFIPPKDWASPYAEKPAPAKLVYCQAPGDDPRAVRGARNVPCVTNPSRREGDARNC